MAAFTSVQTGNWNDGATWGNDSPGAKGTDWPGNAGDTATIANTHVVTYNVSEANALGTVTINSGGELTFHTGMDTLLTLGDVDLNVAGTLKVGTVAAPIGAAYTAVIDHKSTTSSSELIGTSTSEIHICGDPGYFGSNIMATLVADWTSDQVFTVAGDITGDWNSGDTLIVIKDGEYSNFATDCQIVTIDSIALNGANTDITINEAFPGGTYSIGAYVFHVERNVVYRCGGTSPSPIELSTSDSTSGSYDLNNDGVAVIDSARIGWSYHFQISDTTMRYVVLHNIYTSCAFTRCDIEDTILIAMQAASPVRSCAGDNLNQIECSGAGTWFNTVMTNLRFINHYQAILGSDSRKNYLQVEVFKCADGLNAPVPIDCAESTIITGHFGENANGLSYWVNDILIYFPPDGSGGNVTFIKDFHSPITTVAGLDAVCGVYRNNEAFSLHTLLIEALNGDRTNPIMLSSYGSASMITAGAGGIEPNQRAGGNAKLWKAYMLSKCLNRECPLPVPVAFSYLINSPPETLSFKLYFQSNNTGNINYLIKAIQNGIVSYNEGVITPRDDADDWDQYAEINETFSVDGWVDIECILWGYEASKFIWIDPLITVT